MIILSDHGLVSSSYKEAVIIEQIITGTAAVRHPSNYKMFIEGANVFFRCQTEGYNHYDSTKTIIF